MYLKFRKIIFSDKKKLLLALYLRDLNSNLSLKAPLVAFLVLLASSCSSNKTALKPEIKAPEKPVIVESDNKQKKANLVTVTKFTNFTRNEEIKALNYIPKMNETIDSKCFEDFMLKRKLIKTNNKTNKQVLNDLRTKNVKVELITYYKRFSRVAGYTYPNVNKIWLNRKYHAGASLCSEASNLAHEASHKLDYTHSYKATYQRPYSVPYSINAAFLACCK